VKGLNVKGEEREGLEREREVGGGKGGGGRLVDEFVGFGGEVGVQGLRGRVVEGRWWEGGGGGGGGGWDRRGDRGAGGR